MIAITEDTTTRRQEKYRKIFLFNTYLEISFYEKGVCDIFAVDFSLVCVAMQETATTTSVAQKVPVSDTSALVGAVLLPDRRGEVPETSDGNRSVIMEPARSCFQNSQDLHTEVEWPF